MQLTGSFAAQAAQALRVKYSDIKPQDLPEGSAPYLSFLLFVQNINEE